MDNSASLKKVICRVIEKNPSQKTPMLEKNLIEIDKKEYLVFPSKLSNYI